MMNQADADKALESILNAKTQKEATQLAYAALLRALSGRGMISKGVYWEMLYRRSGRVGEADKLEADMASGHYVKMKRFVE